MQKCRHLHKAATTNCRINQSTAERKETECNDEVLKTHHAFPSLGVLGAVTYRAIHLQVRVWVFRL
ncbi:hypothetical protein PSEUDO8O_90098 [Pseudomonas sp. 8O]|nr:hypothetical protein PSEUDO8O_90098 [Pseudomonas sp. 8O]